MNLGVLRLKGYKMKQEKGQPELLRSYINSSWKRSQKRIVRRNNQRGNRKSRKRREKNISEGQWILVLNAIE